MIIDNFSKILKSLFLTAAIFLIFALSGCGGVDAVNSEVNSEVNKVVNKIVNNNDDEAQVFVLDIDGELFDIEMPDQEEYTPLDSEHLTGYTAFDVLKQYAEERGIELKVKEYDFGVFIEGIGDKIGDKNNFWLYYVNGKPANASADKVEVEAGDVIKFEWAGNNPF